MIRSHHTESPIMHTPGPWHIDFFDKPYVLAMRGEDEIYIAEVTDEDSGGLCPSLEEAKANAYLIAAAPQLLECLADALNQIKALDEDFDQRAAYISGMAAIAEATGRAA